MSAGQERKDEKRVIIRTERQGERQGKCACVCVFEKRERG